MGESGYTALCAAWSRDGQASVTFAALQDAGFHPLLECDPRGPMHFYSWPMGSCQQTTIYIPIEERDEALCFLDTDPEPLDLDGADESESYYSAVHEYRRWVYAGWLLQALAAVALFVGLVGVARALTGSRETA